MELKTLQDKIGDVECWKKNFSKPIITAVDDCRNIAMDIILELAIREIQNIEMDKLTSQTVIKVIKAIVNSPKDKLTDKILIKKERRRIRALYDKKTGKPRFYKKFISNPEVIIIEQTKGNIDDFFRYAFSLFEFLFISVIVVVIIGFCKYYYDFTTKKLHASRIQSFEMICAIILFVSALIIENLPDVKICFFFGRTNLKISCRAYPGELLAGLLVFIILFILTMMINPGYHFSSRNFKNITNKAFNELKATLEKKISLIEERLDDNKTLYDEKLQELMNSIDGIFPKWDLEINLLNLINERSDLLKKYSFCKAQLEYIETSYVILLHRAKAAYRENKITESLKLLIKAFKKHNYIAGILEWSKKERNTNLVEIYHLISLCATALGDYEMASEYFIDVLKNGKLWFLKKKLNYDVLATMLENTNQKEASSAARERNLRLIFNSLGLGKDYEEIRITIPKVIRYIIVSIIVLGLFIAFIIFLGFLIIIANI